MASDNENNPLTESGLTIPSDSEQYSRQDDDVSPSPPSSSNSPQMILYKPPTFWGILRGAAINLFLPFVNGLMLGFGELFAHEAAFRLGWSNTKIFPDTRRTVGPGVEIRPDPIERKRREGNLDDLTTYFRSHQPHNMLPSRGLRWSSQAGGLGRRRIEGLAIRQVFHQICPRFSSHVSNRPIRAHPVLPTGGALFSKSFTRSPIAHSIRNGAAIRFASTNPAPTVIVSSTSTPSTALPTLNDASTSAPTPESTFTTTSLDGVTDFQSDLLNMPEHIGYLKELGLDYGFGATSVMEWTLEHIHVFCGGPWWVSIGLAAVFWRLVLAKPNFDAAENATRMAAIKDVTAPIQARMFEANRVGDTTEMLVQRQELARIYRRAGIKLIKSFTPALQIPIGYGTWKLLRAMALLPVPGLLDGGILWFYNLSIPDPYFILPIITSGILHLVLKKGGESGVSNIDPGLQKILIWGMPAVSLVFTSFMPAAVQLSFLVSSLMSASQSAVIRNTTFRRWTNMTPLPSTSPRPNNPGKLRLKQSFSDQVGQEKSMSSWDGTLASVMSGFQEAKSAVMNKAREQNQKNKFKLEKREAERREELAQKRMAQEQREASERRRRERDIKRAEKKGRRS
ncbi:inner membrane oxaA protein [Rutstroemia sp. NJR-2017a BBW]|nr:inner membrane oxaA protein [Rutstroemia sp. NJR-2017a BBW]